MMQTGTPAVTLFGKIPQHGDFVRRNASGGVVQAMDAWLQQGIYAARNRYGGRFDAAYDRAGAACFCFAPPESGAMLVGVLQPSRDRVGRRFPLLVALSSELAPAATVPHRYARFLERAYQAAREAAAGAVVPQDLADGLAAFESFAVAEDGEGAPTYFRETPLVSFWERLWGYPEDSRKYVLFKNLLDLVPSVRAGAQSRSPLVLRFPLCPDGRTAAYDVHFWLEVCRRLLQVAAWQPTFFWTSGEVGAAFLLVSLAPPAPEAFAYLLPDELGGASLCVLEHLTEGSAALAALAIPARYGELLEAAHLTLWDFLQQL